jgi:N-acetylglucosaminyl-diphospho-decaprenol L-rhamnosyltransferase
LPTGNANYESNKVEPQRRPELSIIFVNWNSLAYLRESLESIYATCAGADYEVIVIENASSVDETLAIRQEFPQVRTARSESNLGFAGANNVGAEMASGNYLLFLNPDTRVLGTAIPTMLKQLKSSPNGGAIGCKLLNTDGSIQTSCIQRFPTILNQLLDLEFLRTKLPMWSFWGIAPLYSDTETPVKVEVISGACLMISREAFYEAGRFSDRYFMYAEDVDLCYEVQKTGRHTLYTGAAEVIHHGGGTSKSRKGNAWVAIMQREAILRFCRKTRGSWYAMAYRAATAVNAACRLTLLGITFPFRKIFIQQRIIHSSSSKWAGVLKWALGLNHVGSTMTGSI